MKMGFDPRKTAIEELMQHLNKSDDDDLGAAMKPKGVEVTKVGVMGDTKDPDGDGDDDSKELGAVQVDGSGEPKLTDHEIQELIEALQQKLG